MPDAALPHLFLTGCSGFIGCRLAQLAAQRGYAVTASGAVNNETERARVELLTRAGIRVAVLRLDEEAALTQLLQGHDVVIHLAAAQHESQAPESYFRHVNVEGTAQLIESAVAAGVRRFVYGSTIGVYGAARAGELDERSALAPDNPYGRTKAEAEDVVRGAAARIETVIARISETYGPGDMRLLKLFRAIGRGRFVILGPGSNVHQLVYVDDLCEGLLLAARAPQAVGETIVLAGTEQLTTTEMASAIAGALGRSRTAAHVPLWPFAAAALVFEATFRPLGLKPPLHRRRLDFFRKSFRFSSARARELLAFEPAVSFAEGARRTAEWYQSNALLPRGVATPTPPRPAGTPFRSS